MIFLYDTLLITFDGDIQGNNKKWNILQSEISIKKFLSENWNRLSISIATVSTRYL